MKSIDVLNSYPPHRGTLSSLLESRIQDKACLLFETQRQWTWTDFHKWVSGLSLWLEAQKLSKGSKVAILSRNSDLYVALLYAIADQGLVVVPINPDLKESESDYILQHSETALLLIEKEFAALHKNFSKQIVLDESFFGIKAETLSHKAMKDDLFLILYTSGTTGFPKGVMHSQEIAVMAGEAFVERMLLNAEDRLLCILPLFHINALFYSVMGSFAAGATLLINRKFSASKFWETAAKLKATQVNIIAAIGNILAQRERREFQKHSIQKIYGAPVSPQIEKIFKSEFQVPIVLEGYGMTEIPGAINNQIEGKWKVGSMGVAAKHPDHSRPFTELKIVDENEVEVKTGETGELVVKTPLLMKGYFKDEEQTKASFTTDNYFKTGDLVKKDSDSFYVFVTRKKDIIRRRGENISGAEIDRVLSTHPKIAEAAAIGVASPLGEEDIFLAVVLRDGESLSEKELYTWCTQNLSKMKCPTYIKVFQSLPHTATARVAKFKLKQEPDLMKNAQEFND